MRTLELFSGLSINSNSVVVVGMSQKRYLGPNRRRPVLIIQHTPYEHAAAIRRALESQGIETQVIHPYENETYPDVENIRGVLSLGGPMGANDHDDHSWIPKECELLRAAVANQLPIVGICLGGQLLARALGSKVEKNPRPEIGWHPIRVNPSGAEDRIIGSAGADPLVYHWHFDTFQLPPSATLLASSGACAHQAYRIGSQIYGFQFHPEADHQLIGEWLTEDDIEEHIESAIRTFGGSTIQDRETQRNLAAEGEKASLRIVAGIGQLFQVRPYQPSLHPRIDRWRAKLDQWTEDKTSLDIVFEGSNRKICQLRGHALGSFSLPDGEFLVLKEETTLLWPFRLDYIRTIGPAKLRPKKASKSKLPRRPKHSKK